jgi:hypothetical protein
MILYGIHETTLLAFLIIILIIVIYLAWMVRYKAKAKERLLIIEKDFDVHKLLKAKKNSFSLLKTGIIIISSTIGAFFGIIIFDLMDAPEEVIFFISLLMFTGIGMLIANKVDKSKK